MRRHHLRRTFALAVTALSWPVRLAWAPPAARPAQPIPQRRARRRGRRRRRRQPGRHGPAVRPRSAMVAGQRSTTVRWNRYGTPATLVPRADLQRRSAASDPVAIARAFLADNREAFGVSAAGIDAMDVAGQPADGRGRVRPAAPAVRRAAVDRRRVGRVRDPGRRGRLPQLDAQPGRTDSRAGDHLTGRGAPQAAGQTPVCRPTRWRPPACSSARCRCRRPRPARPTRSSWSPGRTYEPTGYTTYVDARTGAVLLREDLVDHARGQPRVGRLPRQPAGQLLLPRQPGAVVPHARARLRRARSARPTPAPPGTSTRRRAHPARPRLGNSAKATEKWDSLASGTVGTQDLADQPDPRVHLPVDQPVVRDQVRPGGVRQPAAERHRRGDRRTCSPCTTGCTTGPTTSASPRRPGTCRPPTATAAASAATPSAATPRRAAGRVARRRTSRHATTPTRSPPPDGVPPTTNMYLWQPTPARSTPPCVDGDYDMSVIGHEYTHAISGRLIARPRTPAGPAPRPAR